MYDCYMHPSPPLRVDIPALDDRSTDGPAMSALTDQQRIFVHEMLQSGVNPNAANAAAVAAGYAANGGWRMMRNERVLAALHEEAKKRLVGAALTGVNVMIEIALEPGHKDRFQAAKTLAAINGFNAEQKVTVTHIKQDMESIVQEIIDRATALGQDPRPLLLAAGVVMDAIDAQFEDVTDEDEWTVTR